MAPKSFSTSLIEDEQLFLKSRSLKAQSSPNIQWELRYLLWELSYLLLESPFTCHLYFSIDHCQEDDFTRRLLDCMYLNMNPGATGATSGYWTHFLLRGGPYSNSTVLALESVGRYTGLYHSLEPIRIPQKLLPIKYL